MIRQTGTLISRQMLCGFDVEIERKAIKHIYLKIDRRSGHIRISAPYRARDEELCRVLRHKQIWLQKKLSEPRLPKEKTCLEAGEEVYLEGQALCLSIERGPTDWHVDATISQLVFRLPEPGDPARKKALLETIQRQHLLSKVPPLISLWSERLGVQVSEWRLRRMKTRWGSCNIAAQRIWLNLTLARQAPSELEYVIVHELLHLIEGSHNARFYALMERSLPDWKRRQERLTQLGMGY